MDKSEGNHCPGCLSRDVCYWMCSFELTKEFWLCHTCGAVFEVTRAPRRYGMAAIDKNKD